MLLNSLLLVDILYTIYSSHCAFCQKILVRELGREVMGIMSKVSWCAYGDSIAADKVWHRIGSKTTRHYIVYNRGVGEGNCHS